MTAKKPPKETHSSTHRAYRRTVAPARGEQTFQVVVEETDLLVVAEKDLAREISAEVSVLRGQIKAHIALQPEFATSLVPLDVPPQAPDIVRAMAEASALCEVGPMAAVAGAVAQFVAQKFVGQSPNLLVENGGDLFLCSTRERTVGVLADPTGTAHIGLHIKASDFPCALCASSATIGHSLSLGQGDLVVARARSAPLADAAATALCNLIRGGKADLNQVTTAARGLQRAGLDGIFAQSGEHIAVWGRMELTALD